MKGLPAETDFLVVGAGVAGLRAAIELAAAGRVLVLAKESSHSGAAGTIASSLSDEDELILHLKDTLIAGDGLCRPEAVKTLVDEALERIEELIAWGKKDKHGSKLVFESEPSYSHSHVLRAPGGWVGSEIIRVIQAKVRSCKNISVLESEFCTRSEE